MTFSRTFAAVALTVSMAIATIVVFPSSMTSAQAQSSDIRLPPSPYTFALLYENEQTKLEADFSTFSSLIDDDGDVLSGGIFRVTRKNAAPDEKTVFISLNVAVCGAEGIVIVRTREYNRDGEFVSDDLAPAPLANLSADSPGGATYISLCMTEVKPTPYNPSYKAPERYTKFWT